MIPRARGLTLLEVVLAGGIAGLLILTAGSVLSGAVRSYVFGNERVVAQRNAQGLIMAVASEARQAYNIAVQSDARGVTLQFSNNSTTVGNPEYRVDYVWSQESTTITRRVVVKGEPRRNDFLASGVTALYVSAYNNSTNGRYWVRAVTRSGNTIAGASGLLCPRVYCATPVQSNYYSPAFWSNFWPAYAWGVDYGKRNP